MTIDELRRHSWLGANIFILLIWQGVFRDSNICRRHAFNNVLDGSVRKIFLATFKIQTDQNGFTVIKKSNHRDRRSQRDW